MDKYFELVIANVPSSKEELVSALCFDYGCLGVSEDLLFQQTYENYEPETILREKINLKVFFEHRPEQKFFDELQQYIPEVRLLEAVKDNKDWNEEFKKSIVPFTLPGEIWVVPTWSEDSVQYKKKIIIDPGMAFGTGTHDTTQIACQLIEKVLEGHSVASMMDVGTGSGLLAIYASLLGVGHIEATEIDKMARQVARENCELNQRDVLVHEIQIQEVESEFDLVVANIIDGVLVQLREDLLRTTKENGFLILTGILEEREDLFNNQFIKSSQLQILSRVQQGEWVGYLVSRGPAKG
ncbi:MAG: 50S ribosomal protein L11 methyltransferase [Bdellovibrionales bacterium]|nr:50S ribosomal protein L11 methyltransferase [Bdellovibrionales bacterium]